MIKGKRGFTLLEILMVMIITGITLPVVGTAFYMLLKTPSQETAQLSLLNDVNLALNWIHEDINRGQFFAGDPSMLKSITTVDFTTSPGINQSAWWKKGEPTNTSDISPSRVCPNYSWINASDNYRWNTSNASLEGELDTQMFKFTVPASINDSEISQLSSVMVSWKGNSSFNASHHYTKVMIWDNSSGNGSWQMLAQQSGMVQEGWLTGRQMFSNASPPAAYIKNRNIYFLAETPFHIPETCPSIFAWDGKCYQFIDAAIPQAFFKRYEDTTYHKTTALESKDGYYDLMLFMGMPETGYVNQLGLWAVDHPQGTEVALERSELPERSGVIHTIRDPQPVTARDKDGNDVTSLLAHPDGQYWESNLSGKDFSSTDNLSDWITFNLPEERQGGTAKLVIDVKENSDLGQFELWYLYHFILGTPNVDYVLNRVENDQKFIPYFDLQMWLSTAFLVQYWDGSAWVDYASVPSIGMFFGNPQVVPINLSDIPGNQIRLYTPIGLRQIDYVAVDYTQDEPVNITKLAPVAATEYFANGSSRDVLDEVSAADDAYAVIEQGNYINYKFDDMAPPADGMQRTFVSPVGGYYHLNGPEVPENKIGNLPLWEELGYVPYAYSKWILPIYINLQADPCSKYYNITQAYPPFPTNSGTTGTHHSLNTNYIKLMLLKPSNMPNTNTTSYGGFFWVDRTGNQSISYTTHYYWVNESKHLIREEWQDNELMSAITLAYNIQYYEDITFDFYPAGTRSGADILPYVIVNIKANSSQGVPPAYGSSHLALRSTTLSQGMAVLTTQGADTGRDGILVAGKKLFVDGSMRALGNITVTGTDILVTGNFINGPAEAGGYIVDNSGAIAVPKQLQTLSPVEWGMALTDFVDNASQPASNEYIWASNVNLSSATQDDYGKTIWAVPTTNASPVLKSGLYYSRTGNISLGTANVSGMVTLASAVGRVTVTSSNSSLSPFCNGVLLFSNSSYNDSIRFSGNGGAWSGSLFAPYGGVMINGTMTQPFFLFGSVAAKMFNYSANSSKDFMIQY